MGPGAGLIVGIPFVVLTLALIVIFRHERLYPATEPRSVARVRFSRAVAVALVAFVAYLVVSIVITAVKGPPST